MVVWFVMPAERKIGFAGSGVPRYISQANATLIFFLCAVNGLPCALFFWRSQFFFLRRRCSWALRRFAPAEAGPLLVPFALARQQIGR